VKKARGVAFADGEPSTGTTKWGETTTNCAGGGVSIGKSTSNWGKKHKNDVWGQRTRIASNQRTLTKGGARSTLGASDLGKDIT